MIKSLERLMSVHTADVYVEVKLVEIDRPPRADTVIELLRERGLPDEPQEAIYVVAIDPERVRYVACVARGDYHRVVVPIPALLTIPTLAGADHVVIAHNHPSGRLLPSKHDFDMTKQVVEAYNVAGITVDDHLIMGPGGRVLSLREAHVLELPEPRQLEVRA